MSPFKGKLARAGEDIKRNKRINIDEKYSFVVINGNFNSALNNHII
jgi:hypothetical protein